MQYITVIIAGLLISFSGSLPLGNLNIAAMNIAAKESVKNALMFSTGVVLIEMTYLIFSLQAINWISHNNKVFTILQWLVVVMLSALAIASFYALSRKDKEVKNVIIENNVNRLILGISMSAVNPMQIPFWAGWSVYLLTNNVLVNDNSYYILFTLGAGTGTTLALLLFVYAGRKMSRFVNNNQKLVQLVMGILFLIMALYQTYRITS